MAQQAHIVIRVKIVIGTAEPRGAYHLEPMYDAMRASSASFTHLVPYPEQVQGVAWDETVSDAEVLRRADRLVLSGGGFTAWTEVLAYRASMLGIPVFMTELAYGATPDKTVRPRPDHLSAMSRAGAELFAAYHGANLDDLQITGNPLLDTLPLWEPQPGRVLLLSTADTTSRDPDGVLLEIARRLRSEGWKVVVRCHPREDRSLWSGFHLDTSPTAALAARTASAVIGYPGSAHPVCAALGVPLLAVAPTVVLREALPVTHRSLIPTWVESAEELNLDSALAASAVEIQRVCGPIGGSAERVVRFWTQ